MYDQGLHSDDEVPHNTVATPHCSSQGGNLLVGSTTLMCDRGSWNGQQPTCVRGRYQIFDCLHEIKQTILGRVCR